MQKVAGWKNYRTNQNYKMNTQASFLTGIGFIHQANNLLQKGDVKKASIFSYEGIGYMRATVDGLTRVYYVGGLVNYLDQAMGKFLGNEPTSVMTKKHDEYVIHVLYESFKPLENMNYGSIRASQFQQAINEIIHSMTPQEQKNVES